MQCGIGVRKDYIYVFTVVYTIQYTVFWCCVVLVKERVMYIYSSIQYIVVLCGVGKGKDYIYLK